LDFLISAQRCASPFSQDRSRGIAGGVNARAEGARSPFPCRSGSFLPRELLLVGGVFRDYPSRRALVAVLARLMFPVSCRHGYAVFKEHLTTIFILNKIIV
jgi:hypothetical protein